MQALNLPEFQFKIVEEEGQSKIFDPIRKKYLVLTPEEWVRQNFVQYLVQEKNYPSSRILIEGGLKVNQLQKRADILIYSDEGLPEVLVECKAPSIKIDDKAFQQVARYNSYFECSYLMLTNGLQHYCAFVNLREKKVEFLSEIPDFASLSKKD